MRSREGGDGLHENDRLSGKRLPRFLCVVRIVQTDAYDFPDSADTLSDARLAFDQGQRIQVDCVESAELCQHTAANVGHQMADVTDPAQRVEHTWTLFPLLPIANELHGGKIPLKIGR